MKPGAMFMESFVVRNTRMWTLDIDDGLDKEIEIIHALSQDILQFEHMLIDASDMCAELDR